MREELLTIPLPLRPAEGSIDIDPGPEYATIVGELLREIRSVFEIIDVPVSPSSEMVEPQEKYDAEETLRHLGMTI